MWFKNAYTTVSPAKSYSFTTVTLLDLVAAGAEDDDDVGKLADDAEGDSVAY